MFEVSCLKLTEKNGGFIGGVAFLTGQPWLLGEIIYGTT